ncbi:MerR family DNA-binding transcriptional regulator [Pseudomonas gingeri NCPPB 3146 = LMG 5327]|uniref:MerR family DNA-binding transcriptional regulator n=2 Tax=Pseudomonas gingeri TaxID=117681 RepID=A0A7Y8CBW0_9PSED|nr:MULTISPECIES: MerR family transcriptional regulator [Pseudomonas]NVZ24801.1 MerR family DNA-binding transcriptional regulator [Pseudomonas gingeri]NVZ66528.1 MerR family DNA-binding transcriptional regulator [Pseudomonas gingeri]NVZ73430.1 MerR family DNA-binding transcriptional regulator [Pseudomonas gingeri]NWA05592.1 MerR family DNA-binding transcriptional regulator [Pseudomonas gingeri]NWC13169.1 MerR family DNA-binding transcriptional regulator [Pseudomonas gingeri]
MKIGELAQRSGLAASKIRFYEAQGLIRKVHRQANGYREYPSEVLQTLSIIQCAQQAGFSLEELRALVPASEPGVWDHAEMIESLERKIAQIEAMQARLAQSKLQLLGVVNSIRSKPADMPCAENAERLMASLNVPQVNAKGRGVEQ